MSDSEREGFRFLARLREEWLSGANRFSTAGEALFGIYEEGQLIAVGGINRESSDCGRLRRFYVKKSERRKGVGRFLAQHILRCAAQNYGRVILRTDSEEADRFYVSLGFVRFPFGGGPTHAIDLKPESKPEVRLA